jgi:ankyrin repeat protein
LKATAAQISLGNFPLSEPAAIRELLGAGANPNPRARFPILGVAAFQGQLGTARLLSEQGANPNGNTSQNITPLMMAAASPSPNTAMVRLLMDKGADLGAHDKAGRSALDWALTQGDTEVARLLRTGGVAASKPPPPPAAVDNARTIRAGKGRGTGGPKFPGGALSRPAGRRSGGFERL